MMFEVIADRWDYRPRKCSMVSYKRGQRGFLPAEVVNAGVESGHLRLIDIDNA